MAEWFKALPQTVRQRHVYAECTLLALTTDRVKIPAGVCEKVVSDLGLGSGFPRQYQFPPPHTSTAG